MELEVEYTMPKDASGVSVVILNIPIYRLQGNYINVELEVGYTIPIDASGVILNIPIYHLQGNYINVELEVGHMIPQKASKHHGKHKLHL